MTQSDQLASILEDCRYALMDCDRDCDYALIERIDAYRAQADKQGEAVAWLVTAGNGKYTRGIYQSLDAAESFACCDGDSITPLYAYHQQVAQPLTQEQIDKLSDPFIHEIGGDHWNSGDPGIRDDGDIELFARAIEAAQGIAAPTKEQT